MKYKYFASLLKALVYIKRLIWKAGTVIGGLLGRILGKIWRFFVYIKYKVSFKMHKTGFNKGGGWFTTRFFFQIVIAGTLVGAAYPHTTLRPKQEIGYDWRHIKMYNLTKDDLEMEQLPEIEVEEGSGSFSEIEPAWRQEVIESRSRNSGALILRSRTLALAVGERALVKPNPLPGTSARTRIDVEEYTVRTGDLIRSIADYFGVTVETVLWENNLTAKSVLRPGQVLRIPPVNGIMHTVAKGDTVKKIADTYKANQGNIISFNKLSSEGGGLVAGARIMIPGGKKPAPVIVVTGSKNPSASSGTQKTNIAALRGGDPGAPFSNGFIWPTTAWIKVRGVGFGHTGVDIATNNGTALGRPTFAAKDGVVTYAGWMGGYGNLIIINHGGGYETYYGHHSQIFVTVGQRVERGDRIGAIGSTGRSTGPHLHFEIRYNKKTLNPLEFVRPPANDPTR
jgi:murein DD-endopeptidase MepM/ murein hydrolase activator NlpD